jgi:CubicO group peptidase (beta-lactamase class C family)
MRPFSLSGSILLGLASVLLAGCGGDPDKPSEGEATLDFAAFDEAMSTFIAARGLRGASAVIVEKERGIVHTAGYGEFAEDRQYLVMSSSKILSAGILMRLDDQGKLDVDAPLGDEVSGWGGGKSELTLAQLVSGSSGMKGIVDDLLYAAYLCQFDVATPLAECAKAIYTADDAADRRKPDTEFHYGGAPWQLAGGVAEVADGKSWAELFDDTYGPCDVPSMGFRNPAPLSTFTPSEDGSVNIDAVSYPATVDGDMSVVPETDNPMIEGGLFTNVTDYGKILLMHLRGGQCGDARILSEGAVAQMREDRLLAYGGSTNDQMKIILTGADETSVDMALDLAGYGMGWWIDRRNAGVFADPGAYGSNAWIDMNLGYGAFVAIEGKVMHSSDMLSAGVVDSARAIFEDSAD